LPQNDLNQPTGAADRGAAVPAPNADFATEANRQFLQGLVDTLRKREVSWAVIAEQLGVSRQSAWERFS